MIITSYCQSNQNTNEFVLVNKFHTYIPYLQQKILPIKLFFLNPLIPTIPFVMLK